MYKSPSSALFVNVSTFGSVVLIINLVWTSLIVFTPFAIPNFSKTGILGGKWIFDGSCNFGSWLQSSGFTGWWLPVSCG